MDECRLSQVLSTTCDVMETENMKQGSPTPDGCHCWPCTSTLMDEWLDIDIVWCVFAENRYVPFYLPKPTQLLMKTHPIRPIDVPWCGNIKP